MKNGDPQQKDLIKTAATALGRLGAQAANRKRSPAERKALACKAVEARWARYRALKRTIRGTQEDEIAERL